MSDPRHGGPLREIVSHVPARPHPAAATLRARGDRRRFSQALGRALVVMVLLALVAAGALWVRQQLAPPSLVGTTPTGSPTASPVPVPTTTSTDRCAAAAAGWQAAFDDAAGKAPLTPSSGAFERTDLVALRDDGILSTVQRATANHVAAMSPDFDLDVVWTPAGSSNPIVVKSLHNKAIGSVVSDGSWLGVVVSDAMNGGGPTGWVSFDTTAATPVVDQESVPRGHGWAGSPSIAAKPGGRSRTRPRPARPSSPERWDRRASAPW